MLGDLCLSRLTFVAITAFGASLAFGQEYPSKPIRIITASVGGGTDFVARLIAQGISHPLGQPLIVDNRGGIIPGETVAKALPDGYTLLVQGITHWIAPLLQTTPYDPVRDFEPITITDRSPSIVVVHASLPVKSVKELIALAKARPGELNYGAAGVGNLPYLASELFKDMAGVNIVYIPYKSTAQGITDLINGQLHVRFGSGSAVEPHIKSGRLRALAVATAQPSALFPGLPTVNASGLPGYEVVSVTAVFSPAKTPATIINRLNQEIVRLLNTGAVKEKLHSSGAEVVGSSPDQLAATVKSDMAKFGKVIKDAGMKVN